MDKKILKAEARIPLINTEIPIISDELIDIKFGTGALKVTPAHDAVDFEIGQKNNLEVINIINRSGMMISHPRVPKDLQGLSINKAREETLRLLENNGLLLKKEPLVHSVGSCYRCGTTIEPMIMPQWFVKTKPLATPAIKAVKDGQTKIVPEKRFKKMYFDWMKNIKDWNISRQIVWGPRIPAWYHLEENDSIFITFLNQNQKVVAGESKSLLKKYSFNEIEKGLQTLSAPESAKYIITDTKPEGKYLQETDTFDTWFLSGQWPINTLQSKPGDFEYFYPTSVLDTLWDILFFWVGRMMMLGLYLTGQVPFRVVHLHARVVDKHGKKMSKSRGNVVDPIPLIDKYGADALRLALTIGVGPGSDIAISDEKVMGTRNFANKIWNLGRYLQMSFKDVDKKSISFSEPERLNPSDQAILSDLKILVKDYTEKIETYYFGAAAGLVYEFTWHRFADKYVETAKESVRTKNGGSLYTIRHVYLTLLKLLHPFMPFVTEAIWQELKGLRKYPNQLLISSAWPEVR